MKVNVLEKHCSIVLGIPWELFKLCNSNQIYLVTLRPTQMTQASFLQKNQLLQNGFFYIFNAEIAQCRQKLDVILGTKVVQF